MANRQNSTIENTRKNHLLTNRSIGEPEKKIPGALAGATEDYTQLTKKKSERKDTPNRKRSAMSKYAKPAHKAVSRCLGYALTLGFDEYRALGFALILRRHLSAEERAGLAFAALCSLDEHHAYAVASTAIFHVYDGEVWT